MNPVGFAWLFWLTCIVHDHETAEFVFNWDSHNVAFHECTYYVWCTHEHCAVFSYTCTPHVHLIQRSECFSLWHVHSCTRTYRHQRIIHNSFTMNSIQVSILWYATRSYRSRGPSCCHNRYPCCSRRRNICCVHTHGNHISWFSWCKWHDVVYSVILVGNLLADVLYLQQVVCFLLWTAFSAVKRSVRIRVHVHRVYVRWAYRARQFSSVTWFTWFCSLEFIHLLSCTICVIHVHVDVYQRTVCMYM
jgi:hypothetical protein